MRTYRGVTAVALLLLLACGELAACPCPRVMSHDLTATEHVTQPIDGGCPQSHAAFVTYQALRLLLCP
jgi:hypothetical protein